MALTKTEVVGERTFLEDGQLRIRTDTVIREDGVEIARTYRNLVITPGQSLVGQPAEVSRVANADWTPAVVAAFNAKKTANTQGPPS